MRTLALGLMLISGICWGKAPSSTQRTMQSKAQEAQNIYRAVFISDWKSIIKSTDIMVMLAKSSAWHKPNDPDFQRYSKNFIEAVKNLNKAAQDKDYDAVAIGFMGMSFACMHCHKDIRSK